MSPQTRLVTHIVLVLLGVVLMIAGIVTATHGATVIGLIVAGVNAQQFLKVRRAGGR